MSDIRDLSKEELLALAEVVGLWEDIVNKLGRVAIKPVDFSLHLEDDLGGEPSSRYLGWIGCKEHGCYTFQPAADRPVEADDE